MAPAALTAVAALLLLVTALGGGVVEARTTELTVSAAVSLKEAIEEIGRRFSARQPGTTVRFNLGASGELAKQIEAGAPVDAFVSAGQAQMDELERRGLIVSTTRRAFARNVLVVVVPRDAAVDLAKPEDLLDPRVSRVVIGNPRTVPAGQYAEESLRALGLIARLRPKLIHAENVRQALEWVARGEADAAWVYATDAAARGSHVREAFRPREDTYQPIVYPAAAIRASRHPVLATAFVEFLASDDARTVLARFRFLAPPAGAR